MSWGHPELFLAAALALIWIGGCFVRYARRRRRLSHFLGGDEPALRLTGVRLSGFPFGRFAPLAGAVVAMGLALAEPSVPGLTPITPGEPWDVVLAVDIARSMQAPDVVPSRLAGAAAALGDLTDALASHRVGLLLFAGQTYPLSPPTLDHEAIRFFLEGIDPQLGNENDEGTSLQGALAGTLDLFRMQAAPSGGRAVLLVSDGDSPAEDDDEVLAAADDMASSGIRVFVVGAGTERGSGLTRPHLPGRWGGPIMATDGRPVISRLIRGLLTAMADEGHGGYADWASTSAMGAQLATLGQGGGARTGGRYASLGPVFWLALLGFALLMLEGRTRAQSVRSRRAGAATTGRGTRSDGSTAW